MLSGSRMEAAVWSLTDPSNDLLHASLPCHEPGQLGGTTSGMSRRPSAPPNTGIKPATLDLVWLTGLHAVFPCRLPNPPTHSLLHTPRHKKATKRTRHSAAGDAYVASG